jgi:hypothetical protein
MSIGIFLLELCDKLYKFLVLGEEAHDFHIAAISIREST